MKLSKFDDLDGKTDLDKLETLSSMSPTGLIYVQRKYDGISFRAQLEEHDLIITTRNNKQWVDKFFDARVERDMCTALESLPATTQLLGEICCHDDTPLATLAGWVSVTSNAANSEFWKHGQFVIWDIMPADSRTFSSRVRQLHKAFKPQGELVIVAPIYEGTVEEADDYYNKIVAAGGEGVVYRVDPCMQFFDNTPSPHAFKRTKTHTAEGVCIAVEQGLGKRNGMLGAMYLKLEGEGHRVVKVGGGTGMTNEVLTELYHKPPIGKKVTFSYKDLSVNGMPLRPQLIAVRNYE